MPKFFSIIFLICFSFSSMASHVMGGDLTWSCDGSGNYVFELVFYRDCNGAEVNIIAEQLRVWNHPTLTTIQMPFVSREDISPSCSPVVGSPPMLLCGTGSAGGNGIGAIEKVIYRSASISIPGTPPVQGWVFTYENFSRSQSLSNITNPASYGMTLAAKMYAIPGASSGCVDSSPTFLQEPSFVSCNGEPYAYNMNAVDPDLDSLYIDFDIPYDHFPAQTVYDPPNSPQPVPFEPGFSSSSPTPDASLSPLSIPAQINNANGELTFLSTMSGNFNVKVLVKSFRQGVLIAEVEREMQLVVLPCSGNNQPPVINAPFFGNSFDTIVEAGALVDFTLTANDFDLLQDGSSQTLSLTASGPMFGAGFVSTTGCNITPCATLNSNLPVSGQQTVGVDFSWQTTCNHLVNQYGVVADMIPYTFVFKVQDDYCQVPKVSYATVTINVLNPGVIPATQITCIQTDATDQITINWNEVTDPFGTFAGYELYSISAGLLATFPSITTTQYSFSPGGAEDFYISVRSGCNGLVAKNSDTISNIWLNLSNPVNGTAILQWNKPKPSPLLSYNDDYLIYRENTPGIWTLIDSVPYAIPFYKDTIDICDAFLSYKIEMPNGSCVFSSNQLGDNFEDMLTPSIPNILSVGFDSTSNDLLLVWNQNSQSDTYGYVVYTYDASGFLSELDTVWGIIDTTYSYPILTSGGPYFYSVAAFDSCYTAATPVTFQTSAKADINGTVDLSSNVKMCDQETELNWTSYSGQSVIEYQIWTLNNGVWNPVATTPDTFATITSLSGESYKVLVQAILSNGYTAFSNPINYVVPLPQQPSYHYFKLATVKNGDIELHDYIDQSVGISEIIFEKQSEDLSFYQLDQVPALSDDVMYIDQGSSPDYSPWTYRARYIDSCGNIGTTTQEVTTIFLTGSANEMDMVNTINWTPYIGFDGAIVEYRIYRSVDGVFDPNPIAVVPDGTYSYVDYAYGIQTNGKMCYRVDAVEAFNFYSFSEVSSSNDLCLIYKPFIYVPNAFTPGGLNPIFMPVLTNADPLHYEFIVFSRWGERIFETTDLNDGWDGIIKSSGSMATNDVYLYMVTFTDGSGSVVTKRGFVSLIK